MTDTAFVLAVLAVSLGTVVAVLSSRLSERTRVPAPALFLVAAAVLAHVVPGLAPPTEQTVQRVVTVALLLILLDGGMHLGWARVREAAAPIALTGVVGTFLTCGLLAVAVHLVVGLDPYVSLLLATALAPTDPAVVFSVLGRREISGRSGTVLEGESGANDPVGIALLASLLSAGELTRGAVGPVLGTFALQMVVGTAVGVLGGRALLWGMRRVPLPSEALYPLRTLAGALALYGLATLAHGSGFLAVFVAGIVLGDARAPYKREVERFAGALSSLGEIVAFVVLGLTVDLPRLAQTDVWVPGLVLAALLALVVRPLAVGASLLPVRLGRGERAFVLFAGLKGAVPVLLGGELLLEHVPQAERVYGIVVVVVVLSVVVQGGLVPLAARLLRVPMRVVAPEPWALGVRLQDEPEGARLLTVAPGSSVEGRQVQEVTGHGQDAWVSLVVRGRSLLPVRPETRLQAHDELLVLADADVLDALESQTGRS